MKSIYNEYNAARTAIAEEIDTEFDAFFRPFWDKLIAQGVNPRELSHHLQMSIGGWESETVLRTAMKMRKAEKGR